MKKYDSYKDSGIEWIGEIPSHWEVKRFGHLFSFSRGLGITKQDLKDEGIPCVNYGEIHSKYGFSVNPEIHQLKCVGEAYLETADKSLLKRGDFVFADTSEDIEGSGNFTVLDSDIPTFAGYHTVIARHENGNNYKYLAYCFDSLEFRNQIRSAVSGIKVFSITHAILKSSKIQLPSYPEQSAIAAYLDRKTAEIDELIADKKRLLELYEEEKTAIINQAVTKGINPDTPMKDSGIEWLGEIPAHWEIYKISKVVSKITNGYVGPVREFMQSEGIPYIQGIHIKNGTVQFTPIGNYYVSKEWSKSHAKSILAEGDLLVVQTGTIGDVGIVPTEFEGANCHALLILRAKAEIINPLYLLKVLSSKFGFNSLQLIKTGEILHHINGSKLKGVDIPIAPLQEQNLIVHHIDTECARIDAKKSKTQKLIELLTEYRTALISEVVTGKVKVID